MIRSRFGSELLATLTKALDWIEVCIIKDYPFIARKSELSYQQRLQLVWGFFSRPLFRLAGRRCEISAFVYSQAGKRMLIPVLLRFLKRTDVRERNVKINLILHKPLNRNHFSAPILVQMEALGCEITENNFSLAKACMRPRGKAVIVCLDQRCFYEYHKTGVDTVDTLRRFSVKTFSIQHGGSRDDSVRGLASSASDLVLVWGKRAFKDLTEKYGVDQCRLRLVGNPLHDVIPFLTRDKIINILERRYPGFCRESFAKKVVVLATCLHYEYRDCENEEEMYVQFLEHIYESLDFSQITLVIKMHPEDSTDPNIYAQLVPPQFAESVRIIESTDQELNVYALLYIADLMITRASTVAEEALMMGKKVIAFDLIRAGPSKYYKHLELYGSYRTVYASPRSALKEAISSALASKADPAFETIIADMTYLLDGKSADRVVDEIMNQVLS